MSQSVEVTCSICGKSLGDQYKPGDGVALFRAHYLDEHEAGPTPASTLLEFGSPAISAALDRHVLEVTYEQLVELRDKIAVRVSNES